MVTATQDRTTPRKRGNSMRTKSFEKKRPDANTALPVASQEISGTQPQRIRSALQAVAAAGLTAGSKGKRISGRAHEKLFAAAAERSGLSKESDLIEYALAKVALEDDFAGRLLALKGSIDQDIDLEF